MADSQLLHENMVPLCNLAPSFCCADWKKITHHSIFFLIGLAALIAAMHFNHASSSLAPQWN
jgi:hypothetical protein